MLLGAGAWGREHARRAPEPPPCTTRAWRLGHLSEGRAARADHTIGTHSLTWDRYLYSGDAPGGAPPSRQPPPGNARH